MKIFVCLLGLFIYAQGVHFKLDQQELLKLSIKDIRKNTLLINKQNIAGQKIVIFNPWRKEKLTYWGYPFFKVLDTLYSKSWRKASRIVFIARDGYRQEASIKAMIDKAQQGFLAYKGPNSTGLLSFKKKEKTINPNPMTLVWNNFKGKVSHTDVLKWPYQLKTIIVKTK